MPIYRCKTFSYFASVVNTLFSEIVAQYHYCFKPPVPGAIISADATVSENTVFGIGLRSTSQKINQFITTSLLISFLRKMRSIKEYKCNASKQFRVKDILVLLESNRADQYRAHLSHHVTQHIIRIRTSYRSKKACLHPAAQKLVWFKVLKLKIQKLIA